MTSNQANGHESQPTGWEQRVMFSTGPDPIAYVPGELLTSDGDGIAAEISARWADTAYRRDDATQAGGRPLSRFGEVPQALPLVRELRLRGAPIQPNHVFFAACGGVCCGPHPALAGAAGSPAYGSPVYGSPVYGSPVYGSPVYGSPVYGSPVYGSPVYGSPVYGSPVYGSPVYGSPVYGSPVYGSPVYGSPNSEYVRTGRRRSSARRPGQNDVTAVADRLELARSRPAGPLVVVLDTGLAHPDVRPAALTELPHITTGPHGDDGYDVPDADKDLELDPCAGHGTFIAGLVESVAPGARVMVHRVLQPLGDGNENDIAATLDGLPDPGPQGGIVNLSFSGYTLDRPDALAVAVAGVQARGYVVVASAGNDGVCRPTYPAALPDVVSVGAIGPGGPAPFSNYGSWVRACAPGVDVVAPFFTGWNGPEPQVGRRDDVDHFVGWAAWSGTSMSAPVVAGALARAMAAHGTTASQAVERVVDDPALLRLAGLGTVVNVV